jgi:hypothetical protein
MSDERVGSLGASLTVSGESLRIGLVLLLVTCVERHELLPTLLRGGTRHVQTSRKASVEMSNLSNDKICSNYYLSIRP